MPIYRDPVPFNDYRNSVHKPIKGYTNTPITLEDKIRNKRIDLQLNIKHLVTLLKVTDEALIYWENNRGKPKVCNYPKFIEVLGFLPFDIDTNTLGGKLRTYRYSKGLNRKKFSKILGVDETTIRYWEDGIHSPMLHNIKVLQELFTTV